MNSMPLQHFALRTLSGTEAHRRLMIFTYHRVLDRPDPLLPNEPTAAGFAKQVGWMSDFLNVLPLPEASQRLTTGTLPPRAACITFDDGYRNNFEVALPILRRARLPATFFIATGALTEGAMWNDLIIESIRHCGDSFALGRFGFVDYPIGSETDRLAVIDRSLDAMKYLPVDERAARAREIYRTYVGEQTPSLMMAPEMLHTLVDHGHDVGGHTVTHPILSKVDDVRAASEIRDCRDWIASASGRAPTSFAYPNGRPGTDFESRHREMVREAGFTCAVSTTWGCASRSADPMALPRFTPWEMTRSGFFTRLVKTYVQSYLPSRSDA